MTCPNPRGYVDSTIYGFIGTWFLRVGYLEFSGILQGEDIQSSQLQDFIYARADDHNLAGLGYVRFCVGAISRAARVSRL